MHPIFQSSAPTIDGQLVVGQQCLQEHRGVYGCKFCSLMDRYYLAFTNGLTGAELMQKKQIKWKQGNLCVGELNPGHPREVI